MAADKDSPFSNESKYQRALLTGFSLEPNYTMFYLSYLNRHHHPSLGKLWVEIGKRLSMPVPEEITLDKISQVSRQVLQKLENASRP